MKVKLLLVMAAIFTCCKLSFSDDRLTFVSRPFYGWALGVEVSKHYAFAGAGNSLLIFDIHQPAQPTLVATLDFASFAFPLQIKGDTLFLSTYEELHLINIANPSAPRIIHTLAIGASSFGRRDSLYFFADGDLRIFKLTSSGEFIQIGTYRALSKITQVAIQDSIAIIGIYEYHQSDGRLQLLDIGDVSAPKLLWDEFGYVPDKIAIVDGLAFVARLGHIAIYEIGPNSLRKISQTSNLASREFFIKGKTLYAAAGERGVEAYDFSDPHDFKKIGAFTTIGAAQDVFIQETIALVADLSGGLAIFDISDIGNPKPLGHFDRSIAMVEFQTGNKNLFSLTVVPDKSSDYSAQVFQIFDLQSPSLPTLLSNTRMPWATMDMFIKGNHAYLGISSVVDESGAYVYDITNPRIPRKIDVVPSQGNNEAVFVRNNLLFLASQGMRIFDLSSHDLLGEFAVPGTSTDGIFVIGDVVFLWGFSQLYVFNISNRPQIELIYEMAIADIANIAVSPDTIAFIARKSHGLDILDFSKADTAITLTNFNDGDQVNDVYLDGNLAFLAGDKFCRVLEVSNPQHPIRLAEYEIIIPASQISYLTSQGLVYLAGFGMGMLILKFEREPVSVLDQATLPAANFQLFQNYPNPFNPFTTIQYTLPKPGDVALKVYDFTGKEVTTLVNEKKVAGTYRVHWKASELPSGIYLYRLRAGEYVETRKLVLLK